MRMRTWTLGGVLALAVIGGGWKLLRPSAPPAWRLVELQRGDVRTTVSSTGTLQASTTVEVGTQISGIVADLTVDFNDRVAAGQVLARIDTSLLEADVAAAEAAHDVAQAEDLQSRLALDRLEKLTRERAASPQDLELARTAASVAAARLRQARVALERARANLGYATIRSPIDGTIVRRDVDVGQTVNAGLQAPTLFLIAGDLGTMQILAAVDEADIGRIAPGQTVEFTVATFPDRRFHGEVSQVRLQSTMVENVVTYTVVIDVENEEQTLLPGMTATVDFVVAEALDVLCAPNAALRFRPDPDMLAARPVAASPPSSGPPRRGRRGAGGKATLWRVDLKGQLTPLEVEAGFTDGTCTVVSGEGLSEGLSVVAGVSRAGEDKAASGNPLGPGNGSRRWRPGGF